MSNPKTISPADAIAALGQAFQQADSLTREMVLPLLAALLKTPEKAEHYGLVLERTLNLHQRIAEEKAGRGAQVLTFDRTSKGTK